MSRLQSSKSRLVILISLPIFLMLVSLVVPINWQRGNADTSDLDRQYEKVVAPLDGQKEVKTGSEFPQKVDAVGTESEAARLDQSVEAGDPTISSLRIGPWTEPLRRLIEKGKYSSEVAAELTAIFECQPGIGDQLMQLLVEGQGSLLERRALLVALGTALSMDPAPPELWLDRRGVLEWAIELWIEGFEDFKQLDRWLWKSRGVDGLLAFAFVDEFLSDPDQYPPDSGKRSRWRKAVIEGLKAEAEDEVPSWLKQWTLEWTESEDPEFRRIALGVMGKVYSKSAADDRRHLRERILRQDLQWQLEAGKELLIHTEKDHFVTVIDDWADFFIRQEYRGSEMLSAFHRARDIPLGPILNRRGGGPESQAYRMWVLFGALGGRDEAGLYPTEWMTTLEETVRSDQARAVRFLALRLCAMGWKDRSNADFQELVRRAELDPVQENHVWSLLPTS
ncbi:MAG: hypothetical protein CBC13_03460 [Planctomycetia bacterium TMED53]|nr:MAG: hypothetical protein CBC13_03460 [Planctomycetia bacterium TMED53]